MTQPDSEGSSINLNKPDPANELRIDPPHTQPASHDVPGWVNEATQQAQQTHTPPQVPQPQPDFNARQPAERLTGDAAPLNIVPQSETGTRKLVAGLLAIFLGAFGAHKFYLGRTTPGLIVLLAHIGGWFVTLVLSILTLGLGAIILVPLMGLVASALCIVGLIEGVVYLTRSDEEFAQIYLIGKKDWF
ncbi:TM2 domain-containing protein [Deinococcus alpinitundrae]|uniref:TM2 domain-containing protein n=1 Tax=Deinococcus alpinitundrae TaxID=468913 RepID=UPI00192A42D9|nr:TM2 domain-containing protein [Deinococcus alpinitundrae]